MYEYVGKTQKSFMRGVITFSSGITYTLMPNWPSSKRKITIFCQMDQCVYYILKAIHACPNATWKVCSHILVSKKSRRESWHKRERDTPWSENSEEEKIPPQSWLILIHGDLYETRGMMRYRVVCSKVSLCVTMQFTKDYPNHSFVCCRYEAKHSIISLLCQRFINMCDMCDVHIFWGLSKRGAES